MKSFLNYILEQDQARSDQEDVEKMVYQKLGLTQREEPETAMRNYQIQIGGGVLSYLLEHVGDLTHRMTIPGLQGYDVKNKIKRAIQSLRHPYGFEREHLENIKAEANYKKISAEELTKQADELLKQYANAHRKLPAFNEAHHLARDAAVALGMKKYNESAKLLEKLDKLLPDNDRELRTFLMQITYPEK